MVRTIQQNGKNNTTEWYEQYNRRVRTIQQNGKNNKKKKTQKNNPNGK
jgi:hypothetical protein